MAYFTISERHLVLFIVLLKIYIYLNLGGFLLKSLDFYNQRQLSCESQVFDYFMATLKDSIFTWNYFVDFNKAIGNVKKYSKELEQLNMLIGRTEETIEDAFIKLVKSNPKVRKVLPLLIAVRNDKFKEMPIINDLNTLIAKSQVDLFDPSKKLDSEMEKSLILFFNNSGLKSFFVNKDVVNLLDYCKGIEVGMDTNARKNRTGTLMEGIVGKYLDYFTKEYGGEYIEQATKNRIYEKWKIDLELDKIDRRIDFALLSKTNKLYLFEVNYYSGGGSKLKATAGEYKDLEDLLKGQGFTFVWITDGNGWLSARTAINETFNHNDYVINLKMISDGILSEIIK